MARNIETVIDSILELFPDCKGDEYCYPILREKLEKVKDSARYTAPEAMGIRWAHLCESLSKFLPIPPKEEWQIKIGQIVRGEII